MEEAIGFILIMCGGVCLWMGGYYVGKGTYKKEPKKELYSPCNDCRLTNECDIYKRVQRGEMAEIIECVYFAEKEIN